MKSRLALVACEASAEGPWLRSRGNETGVRVSNLEEGGRIIMKQEFCAVLQQPEIFDSNGTFSLQGGWQRISFEKVSGQTILPTQVELLANGNI